MSTSPLFSIESDGETLVIAVRKSVSSLADEEILSQIESLRARLKPPGARNLVIDFAHIDYFGSSMLEAVRELWKEVEAHGGKIALCNVSNVGREILHLSRFDTIWPIHDNRAEACAAVRSDPDEG